MRFLWSAKSAVGPRIFHMSGGKYFKPARRHITVEVAGFESRRLRRSFCTETVTSDCWAAPNCMARSKTFDCFLVGIWACGEPYTSECLPASVRVQARELPYW